VTGVPASAIPSNGHPDLKGMSITFADQGSPDPSRILNYHIVGLLKSWGANAKMDWTQSEQIASAAISSGQAQVIMGTIPNQLPAVESGFNVKAFGIDEPRVDYAFVTSHAITSISQLRGMSVGVLTGGSGDISYVLAVQALAVGGLKIADVHMVKTGGQTARISALASGLIQASVVGHESLYELKSLGVHNLFDFTTKDKQLYNDLLWAPPAWLKANPKMAVAIDLAALDSYKWFENKANAQAAINQGMANSQGATLTTTTVLYNLLRGADVYNPGTTITKAGLTYQQDYYVKAGTLPSAEPIADWSTTIYDAAALQAYNASSK
jgi:ABC-type nitrate/sulfonate/bicarbonate transport system substrate-binding protein